MSHQLPDVQASQPDVTVGSNQADVTGVKKLVKTAHDRGRSLVLMTEFEVFVDLPSDRKGIDMSRNMQAINEILEVVISEPAYHVEGMYSDTAEHLLAKHEYATTAEVSMTTGLVVREGTPASGLSTQSTAKIITSTTTTDEDTRKEIGAGVVGVTVCPYSQGTSASRARDVSQDLAVNDDTIEEFLDKVPQSSHFQRDHAMLTIKTQGSPEVDFMDLIDIAHNSMSARIYSLTKHPDEDHVTYRTYANTKFVESYVRSMVEPPLEASDHLRDDAVAHMKQPDGESIHRHNAHAEREVTLGQLRDGLDA